MKCCVKCFKDAEIIAIIDALNQKGDCDICGCKNTNIYDIDKNNALSEMFDGLLDIYNPDKILPDAFPREYLSMLEDDISTRWSIFNLDKRKIYALLKLLCHEKHREHPEIFDSPVGILATMQNDFLEKNSILKTFQWEDFVGEIKNTNRFHTNHINKEVLSLFFRYGKELHKSGEVYFRGRICPNENGFNNQEMGAPPVDCATGGRANPEGISCLYLADSEKTVLHEVRAGIYDFVTIGEFELLHDIEVVNLDKIDKISPFLDIDLVQHAINIENLRKIGFEIAKPLRRHDSKLDYLPTQYISDFIKSEKYHGIEYKSTMTQNGYNLAIFNENCFRCIRTHVIDVTSLQYEFRQC